MCDPWQTQVFLAAVMDGGAAQTCGHCLPDCVSTVYSSSVSATPLRRCDTKNIGLTYLCKFDGDVPLPAIWSDQVISEYKKSYPEEELPGFLRLGFTFIIIYNSVTNKVITLLRPHVKDNSKRKYLQKTKTQAIFEGKH